MKRKLAFLICLFLGVSLSGCGSSSDTSDISTSGVVVDGYLYKAKVCIDKNYNNKCDDSEPYTYTDEGGRYTIPVNAGKYPVIAEVNRDTKDVTYDIYPGSFTLFAVPGKPQIISPISTLGAGLYRAGLSIEEINQKLKDIFGVDISEDYIALRNATVAAKAYLIAKLFSYFEPQEVSLFAESIVNNDTIVDSINNATSSVQSLENVTSAIDSTDLEDLKTSVENAKDSAIIDMLTVEDLQSYTGVPDLDSYRTIVSYGNVTLIDGNNIFDCAITGKDIEGGIDITIKRLDDESQAIYSTDTPIFTSPTTFVAKVTNATFDEDNFVVVSAFYDGKLLFDSLDGTFKNMVYDETNKEWKDGITTYVFNKESKTLEINNSNGEEYSLEISYDNNTGEIEGKGNEIGFKIFPVLKDESGDVLIFLKAWNSTSGKVNFLGPQILIKQ